MPEVENRMHEEDPPIGQTRESSRLRRRMEMSVPLGG